MDPNSSSSEYVTKHYVTSIRVILYMEISVSFPDAAIDGLIKRIVNETFSVRTGGTSSQGPRR